MNTNFFKNPSLIQLLKSLQDKNKKKTKGAFGKVPLTKYDKDGKIIVSSSAKNLGNYKTLRVLPKHKQTKDNCNYCGVQND